MTDPAEQDRRAAGDTALHEAMDLMAKADDVDAAPIASMYQQEATNYLLLAIYHELRHGNDCQ